MREMKPAMDAGFISIAKAGQASKSPLELETPAELQVAHLVC